MDSKVVKVPMIVSLGLYGTAVLIDICVMLMQNSIFYRQAVYKLDKFLIPTNLFWHIFTLVVFAAFFCVIMLYKGSARRIVSWVMLGVHFLLSASSLYVSLFINNTIVRVNSMEYTASMSLLNATAQLFTSPFTSAALICVLVAIGRYGIMPQKTEQE